MKYSFLETNNKNILKKHLLEYDQFADDEEYDEETDDIDMEKAKEISYYLSDKNKLPSLIRDKKNTDEDIINYIKYNKIDLNNTNEDLISKMLYACIDVNKIEVFKYILSNINRNLSGYIIELTNHIPINFKGYPVDFIIEYIKKYINTMDEDYLCLLLNNAEHHKLQRFIIKNLKESHEISFHTIYSKIYNISIRDELILDKLKSETDKGEIKSFLESIIGFQEDYELLEKIFKEVKGVTDLIDIEILEDGKILLNDRFYIQPSNKNIIELLLSVKGYLKEDIDNIVNKNIYVQLSKILKELYNTFDNDDFKDEIINNIKDDKFYLVDDESAQNDLYESEYQSLLEVADEDEDADEISQRAWVYVDEQVSEQTDDFNEVCENISNCQSDALELLEKNIDLDYETDILNITTGRYDLEVIINEFLNKKYKNIEVASKTLHDLTKILLLKGGNNESLKEKIENYVSDFYWQCDYQFEIPKKLRDLRKILE